jgi:MinD-like ATPase involved in chromosome partitioning or flagellar assembly
MSVIGDTQNLDDGEAAEHGSDRNVRDVLGRRRAPVPVCTPQHEERAVVTSRPIDAADDGEWLELTPLGAPPTSADRDADAEAPAAAPGHDPDVTTRSAPTASADDGSSAASAVRTPAPSLPRTRSRNATQPALLGRARALLTDKLVAEERECDAQLGRLRVRGMSRSVVLAVSSIKGGIGKTTIARALADAFQDGLRQNTLLADLDLEWGTAVATAPAESHRESSILDVYRRRDQIHQVGDLIPHLTAFGSGALLLPAPRKPRDIDAVTPEVLDAALSTVRQFFQIIVLDLPPGAGIKNETCRWAYGAADEALVVTTPTKATVDYQLRHILEFLRGSYEELPLHVALNVVPPRPGQNVREALAIADSILDSRRVLRVHRDDGLARQIDEAALDIGQLGVRTRVDIKRLAASLAAGWCR